MSVFPNRWFFLVWLHCLSGCAGVDAPSLSTGALSFAPAATSAKPEFDCVRARQNLSALATSLAGLEPLARKQIQELPMTAVATFQRLGEPRGPGLAAVAQFEDERARFVRLAASATGSSCPIRDIEATVQAADEKMSAFRSGK